MTPATNPTSPKRYLVTGSAGFIGFHLSRRLLGEGHTVVGLDNLNPYYPVALKEARNAILTREPRYTFIRGDVEDTKLIDRTLKEGTFDTVFHLAAQAGVRHSLEEPWTYVRSNIDGTLSILEAARHFSPQSHLLIASSSSVYGASTRFPFREDDSADQPLALYGATKRADELMAHAYSHLFGLRTTMLRFFTVYGPWGRPDMALFKFTRGIRRGEKIAVYNGGEMIRDFTYVDDIVEGMLQLDRTRGAPGLPLQDVFNIGCSRPTPLMDFIRAIESSLGMKAKIDFQPLQPGDVLKTYADVSKLQKLTGYAPTTTVERGVKAFVDWYTSSAARGDTYGVLE